MAISTLSTVAKEGGTCILTLTFLDEDGNAVTPTSATWTLTDSDGAVVNSRLNVVISALGPTASIVLTGNDLPSGSHYLEELLLTVNAVYDSVAYGNGLPLIGQVIIPVEAV